MSKTGDPYAGPVVFVDGVHYPVGEDGHADTKKGLRWDAEREGYVFAADDAPSHFDTYHQGHVELEFEGTGSVEVTPEEADAVKALLAELRSKS